MPIDNQGKMLPGLLEEIRKLVIADLKASLIKNRNLLEWVRYLIDPAQKSSRTSGAVKDDDLDFLTDAEAADVLAVAEPKPPEQPATPAATAHPEAAAESRAAAEAQSPDGTVEAPGGGPAEEGNGEFGVPTNNPE